MNPLMQINKSKMRSLYFFPDLSFANTFPNRRSMQSHCGLLNGVMISWSTNIQTPIAADSTDAEICSLYYTVKKIVSFSYKKFDKGHSYTSSNSLR